MSSSSFLTSDSFSDRGDRAICDRLQRQLDQAKADLAEKDNLHRDERANVALQKHRVEELEREVASRDKKYKKLQEELNQLQEKFREEQRRSENQLLQKDETIEYFRNEVIQLSKKLEGYRRAEHYRQQKRGQQHE